MEEYDIKKRGFHTFMRIVLTIITVKLNVALCGAHFTKTQSAIRIKALKQKKGSSLPRSLSGQLNKHNFQIIFKLHAGAQAESRDSGQQSARSPFPVPLSSFPTPHGKQLWALNFRSNTHTWTFNFGRSGPSSPRLDLACPATALPAPGGCKVWKKPTKFCYLNAQRTFEPKG